MKRAKTAIHKRSFYEQFFNANDSEMEASFIQSILWSLLFLNLFVSIAVLLVYLLSETNAVIYIGSYLLLCTITFGLSISALRPKLGFGNGIVLSLLTWLLMGFIYFIVNEYLSFYHWKYDVVKNISVKEVNLYPNASAFYFNDGKILLDKHSSSYYITGGEESTGSVTSYLVPFVPNDWKDGDSVNVFLFGEENNQYEYMVSIEYSDFYEDLKHAYSAGLVLRVPSGTDLYTEKIAEAVKTHQFKIPKDPFILKWVQDPEKEVKDFFISCVLGLLYFNIAWLVFVFIRRFYFAYKRSRKNYKPKID